MNRLVTALAIGLAAGILDIVPMIVARLDWHASLSAFAQWAALGIVIAYVQMPLPGWLKGLVVSELLAVPIMVLVSVNGLLDVVPIALMSALLGSLVGWATTRFAGPPNGKVRG